MPNRYFRSVSRHTEKQGNVPEIAKLQRCCISQAERTGTRGSRTRGTSIVQVQYIQTIWLAVNGMRRTGKRCTQMPKAKRNVSHARGALKPKVSLFLSFQDLLTICHKGDRPRTEKVGQEVENPANGPESQKDPTAGK